MGATPDNIFLWFNVNLHKDWIFRGKDENERWVLKEIEWGKDEIGWECDEGLAGNAVGIKTERNSGNRIVCMTIKSLSCGEWDTKREWVEGSETVRDET